MLYDAGNRPVGDFVLFAHIQQERTVLLSKRGSSSYVEMLEINSPFATRKVYEHIRA